MATLEECHDALERLIAQLAASAQSRQRAHTFDRTISCHILDLDITFSGELAGTAIRSMTTDPAPRAQIRFAATSDDLVAVADGRLPVASAWKAGRLKVQASMMDLLKLKSMF